MPKAELVDLPKTLGYKGPIDQLIALLTKYKKQYGAKARVHLASDNPWHRGVIKLEQRVKEKEKEDAQ